jgi:hypothetical protein
VITSDKQIIDNLSRIKVLPKINFNNNEILSIDSKSESLKSITSNTSSNISFNSIDLSPKPVNDSNALKTNFCEVNSFKPQLVANSISLNSEELLVNFFSRNFKTIKSNKLCYETTVIKVDNISYIALTLSSQEINAFNLLLQTIISNVNLLRNKSSNTLEPNGCWAVASNEMIRMGHKEWQPSKCRAIYYTSINLYRKV